jgi:hypothetical protein
LQDAHSLKICPEDNEAGRMPSTWVGARETMANYKDLFATRLLSDEESKIHEIFVLDKINYFHLAYFSVYAHVILSII